MKKLIIILLLNWLPIISISQNCQQEEIKIRYSNGIEIFNICKSNPTIYYHEDKDYYWYTEFSNVKSTKGGCGGNLLHGNYKFYDENGNLIIEKNYFMGLEDGNEVRWDSDGDIVSKATYAKGKAIYMKFLNENDYWIEYNGAMIEEGTIKKVFTKYNVLLEESKMLDGLMSHVKTYYEFPHQLKEEYTTSFGGFFMKGDYKAYYENGKIQVKGQFEESNFTDIKVGVWKYYNKDGTVNAEENYKADVQYWSNGEIKVAGGYILDEKSNEWLKIDEWTWYDEAGNIIETKKYIWGVEVENE